MFVINTGDMLAKCQKRCQPKYQLFCMCWMYQSSDFGFLFFVNFELLKTRGTQCMHKKVKDHAWKYMLES